MELHYLIILFCSIHNCLPNNVLAQTPDSDPTDCKVKYTFGYTYNQFFRFPDSSFKNGTLMMRFLVRASSDAHILLATSLDKVEETEPVYEIVLGGGRNKFSEIRRMRRASTRHSASTPNVLSLLDLRGFWVRLTKEGLLTVGKLGEEEPFLSWKDDEALPIRYFAFSTWTNVYGKWFFDCESHEENESTIVVERPLTWIERLRRDLLTNYDPMAIPKENISEWLPIDINFQLQHVDLDWKKSEITVAGIFMLSWDDDKLKWEPSEFNNIHYFQLVHGEIWRPELILYNAVGHGAEPLGETGMIASYGGRVIWSPNSMMQAHCDLDLSDWPWDEHTCELQLGLWSSQNLLQLVWTENVTEFITLRSRSSGWKIVNMDAKITVIDTPWNTDTGSDSELLNNTDTTLILSFTLRRISTTYKYVFLIPLAAIAVSCLASFGLSLLQTEKIGIQCLCLILCSMFLLALDNALPATALHTPYIFTAYSRVLVLLTISTVSAVGVTSITRQPHVQPPHRVLLSVLQNPSVQLLLYLPRLNQGSQRYGHIREEDEGCHQSEDLTMQYWTLFATAIDRITLFGTLASFIVIAFF